MCQKSWGGVEYTGRSDQTTQCLQLHFGGVLISSILRFPGSQVGALGGAFFKGFLIFDEVASFFVSRFSRLCVVPLPIAVCGFDAGMPFRPTRDRRNDDSAPLLRRQALTEMLPPGTITDVAVASLFDVYGVEGGAAPTPLQGPSLWVGWGVLHVL